jgi:hypothetical protein
MQPGPILRKTIFDIGHTFARSHHALTSRSLPFATYALGIPISSPLRSQDLTMGERAPPDRNLDAELAATDLGMSSSCESHTNGSPHVSM